MRIRMLFSAEDIYKSFYVFAASQSNWLDESYELDAGTKDESVICLSSISGAARFVKELLKEDAVEDEAD